jgi:predicted phosphodiesterase
MFTFLSDTHGKHRRLTELPDADIFVHAGDVTRHGKESEVQDFIAWLAELPYRYKIFIAGNHANHTNHCSDIVKLI